MLWNAHNGWLKIGDTDMDYVRFGSGEKILVMLPGLGDGLATVKGTAVPMSAMYRLFAKDYTVYMFSRKNGLPDGYTTRDMARDQAEAMKQLGIGKASVVGVSMGGMIAQHLAADYPEMIEKLVLVVTSSRPNEILNDSVTEWMEQAIKSMGEEFTKVVQESSQNVANNMFAGVLGAMTQQMNMGVVPMASMQMSGVVPNGMTVAVANAMSSAVAANVPEPAVPDNELAADTSKAMDSATKNMLGSLFDMDDE